MPSPPNPGVPRELGGAFAPPPLIENTQPDATMLGETKGLTCGLRIADSETPMPRKRRGSFIQKLIANGGSVAL